MVRAVLTLICALMAVPAAAHATHDPYAQPLVIPPPHDGGTIEVDETAVSLWPGAPATTLWTYDGTFPGPTIRAQQGDETTLTFENRLADAITVHRHGAHTTPEHDGQPHEFLVDPGATKQYTYELDERGATEWYHDHRLDKTARNVWQGLAGFFILEPDPASDEGKVDAGLPSGDQDVPLMFTDRRFTDGNGTLDGNVFTRYPDAVPFNGLVANHLLVNGRPQPAHPVQARRHRLRLLNASNARVFNFTLRDAEGDALTMQQVATESGLLPQRVDRTTVELGPAERAEVIVDFAGRAGQQLVLDSGTALGGAMRFDVSVPFAGTDDTVVPQTLTDPPELDPEDVTRSRSFALGASSGKWTIDTKTFDPKRIDAGPKLGATERWVFKGGGSAPHTVHLHGVDFVVDRRNGQAPPAHERGYKETVLVRGGETVELLVRFTDFEGTYVFHCHVLEHEDLGMMGLYRASVTGGGETPDEQPTVDPTVEPTVEPTATPEVPDPADLEVAWTAKPRKLGKGTARLRVHNAGELASAPASLTVALPKGFAARRRITKAIPALAAGAQQLVAVKLRAPKRLPRKARLVATLGEETATLRYKRKGRSMKLTGAVAAAARDLLCRLA